MILLSGNSRVTKVSSQKINLLRVALKSGCKVCIHWLCFYCKWV